MLEEKRQVKTELLICKIKERQEQQASKGLNMQNNAV